MVRARGGRGNHADFIQNDPIEEVFVSVLDTQRKSGHQVPIHIFPARLDTDGVEFLEAQAADDAAMLAFWNEFVPIYEHFERNKTIPAVATDKRTGSYTLRLPDPHS